MKHPKNRIVLLLSLFLCTSLTACAGPFAPALRNLQEQRAARQEPSGVVSSAPEEAGPSTSEEAQRLIQSWADSHPLEEDVNLLENAEGSILSDGSACFSFDLFLEGEPVAIIYVSQTDGTLLVGPGTETPIDEWYELYWMGPEGGDSYGYDEAYQPPMIDPALCGRWRGSDGSVLELDEYGTVNKVTFRVWQDYFHNPESVTWEASNGCVTFLSRFFSSYEWSLDQYESSKAYVDPDTGDVHAEKIYIDELTLKNLEAGGGTTSYLRQEGTEGEGMLGEWKSTGGLGGPLILYEDGSGSFGTNPITWYSDGEYYYQTGYQTSSLDYYVAGDLLTLYFSDGTKYLTRVGN